MDSEAKAVLSDKHEGSGSSSEVESDKNVQHEKKSDVRYFILFWG